MPRPRAAERPKERPGPTASVPPARQIKFIGANDLPDRSRADGDGARRSGDAEHTDTRDTGATMLLPRIDVAWGAINYERTNPQPGKQEGKAPVEKERPEHLTQSPQHGFRAASTMRS